MPAAIGVTETHSIIMAASAEVNEMSDDARLDKAFVRNESGVTVHHRAKKLITHNITLRGKGDPNFAGVAAGSFSEGTAKVTAAEQVEYNDGEYADFTIEALKFTNWTAPA